MCFYKFFISSILCVTMLGVACGDVSKAGVLGGVPGEHDVAVSSEDDSDLANDSEIGPPDGMAKGETGKGVSCPEEEKVNGQCVAADQSCDEIQACIHGDQCCPTHCFGFDSDCGPVTECGNGVLDSEELCDVGIEAGESGACPDEDTCKYEQSDACHPMVLKGEGCFKSCQAAAEITTCTNDDQCCPEGCAGGGQDNDC